MLASLAINSWRYSTSNGTVVNLAMNATLGNPSNGLGLGLTGNLDATWSASGAAPSDIGSPRVSLSNVQLDVGALLGNFLQPIIADIQAVTEPLQPIINLLETPVPILSELEGSPVTFADLLDSLSGVDVSPFVNAIDTINRINIDQLSGTISLGSFDLTDPSNVTSTSGADVFGQLSNDTSNIDALSSIGFDFPILDHPTQLVSMLVGQDATFFTWQTPTLHGVLSYSQTFYPIFDIPIFYITVTGAVSFDAAARFGYDSAGLRSGNPLDGFWVQDGLVDGQGNPFIAQITPSLSIQAGLGPGDFDLGNGYSLNDMLDLVGLNLSDVITADATGTLSGNVEIGLNNADSNGAVRFDQINFNDPFHYGLASIRAELSYDLSLDIPGLTIGGGSFLGYSLPSETIGGVSLGPGHVVVGIWQLWPSFQRLS
jgi:hypothetical protein